VLSNSASHGLGTVELCDPGARAGDLRLLSLVGNPNPNPNRHPDFRPTLNPYSKPTCKPNPNPDPTYNLWFQGVTFFDDEEDAALLQLLRRWTVAFVRSLTVCVPGFASIFLNLLFSYKLILVKS